jgi:L-ascorbate metabolism protein UlaG (beta-lactamase superfamily)
LQINYIGHATFELVEAEARVLIDPFLAPHNPAAQVSADDVEPTHVLLTHGHQDHVADAVAVAKRTGASCVAITELAGWLEGEGARTSPTPTSAAPRPSTGAASPWCRPGTRTRPPTAPRSARRPG